MNSKTMKILFNDIKGKMRHEAFKRIVNPEKIYSADKISSEKIQQAAADKKRNKNG